MSKEPSRLSFLCLPPEIRRMIYRELFTGQYEMRPIARIARDDFPFNGGWRIDRRAMRASVNFLQVSRQLSKEACEVLYGSNHFHLFAVDHGDIFKFLKTIGGANRRRIRFLKIDWVYGVLECTENGGVQSILDNLDETRVAVADGSNPFWRDIWGSLLKYRTETAKHTRQTLNLLSEGHGLKELTVIMPGRDGANVQVDRFEEGTFEERYDLAYFGWELFHHEAEVKSALKSIRGLEKLSVGNTACLGEVEDIARHIGAKNVSVFWTDSDLRLEDYFEITDSKEKMMKRGWTVDLASNMAYKLLYFDSVFSDPRDFVAWRHCRCYECDPNFYPSSNSYSELNSMM